MKTSPSKLHHLQLPTAVIKGGNKRRKHQIIQKELIIGNIAFPNTKKTSEEYKWYKWCCYVRGQKGEDISYFVKKVEFNLDPSFPDHHRGIRDSKLVVEEYPFEIHEEGWGEFEIQIRITFQDPSERPIDIMHNLMLDPPEGQKQQKYVINESYDVVVFCEPTETFYATLISKSLEKVQTKSKFAKSEEGQDQDTGGKHHKYGQYFQTFDDSKQVQQLCDAISFMRRQNQKLRDEYRKLEEESIKVRKQTQGMESEEDLPSMNYTASINDFRMPQFK